MAWDKVCIPIKQRGLNVINLQVWNKITMMKCLWNINMKVDNLWVKWIHIYYLKGRDVMEVEAGVGWSWIMKHIMKQMKHIDSVQQTCDRLITRNKYSMREMYATFIDDNTRVN